QRVTRFSFSVRGVCAATMVREFDRREWRYFMSAAFPRPNLRPSQSRRKLRQSRRTNCRRSQQAADRFNMNRSWDHIQNKYVGTGHSDTTKL
ncbi:unnamed protein product, partial [Ectocarpus sp. 12 AP-2014]